MVAEEIYSARNEPIDMIVPIGHVRPSQFNPRKRFDEVALQELAESIREHGLLEPIVVRPCPPPKGSTAQFYEIVAGERRWRACKLADLRVIPVRVHLSLNDEQALRLAIIENVQRQDLDPLEEAAGYRALANMGMKQAEIAESVHRSQPAIANTMRLLKLPESVQEKVRSGDLTASHGIALASYEVNEYVQEALAELAVKEKWPTKKLEAYFADTQAYYLPDSLKQHVYEFRDTDLWDWKVECRGNCPHNAFRASSQDWRAWCLRPGCYEEKRTAANKAKQAATEKKLQEARAISGVTLIKARDLGFDGTDYYTIYSGTRLPAGCQAGCEKRVKALDGADQVAEICSDAKCWKRLEMAATRAQNKAGRELMAEQLAQLEAKVDRLGDIGPREMAVIAQAVMISEFRLRTYLVEACKRQGQLELKNQIDGGYSTKGSRLDFMATLGTLATAKVLIEAICRMELIGRYQERWSGESPTADWYLKLEARCDVCIPANCEDRCGFVDVPEAEAGTCPQAGLPCDPATCVQDCAKAAAAQQDTGPLCVCGHPLCSHSLGYTCLDCACMAFRPAITRPTAEATNAQD